MEIQIDFAEELGKAENSKKEFRFPQFFFVSYLTQADLRHSHVSLLISMGFSAVSIGNRAGHESVDITFRYAHMFPTEQIQMAELLNAEFKEGTEA